MAVVTVCSDFGVQENKAGHCFQSHPFFCHEVMGLDTMIITFFNVELINWLVNWYILILTCSLHLGCQFLFSWHQGILLVGKHVFNTYFLFCKKYPKPYLSYALASLLKRLILPWWLSKWHYAIWYYKMIMIFFFLKLALLLWLN